MTLEDALKQALSDDEKVSKFEAKVIKEIILSDNKITPQERQSLELALHNNKFDKEAYELLSELLVRTDLNTVNK